MQIKIIFLMDIVWGGSERGMYIRAQINSALDGEWLQEGWTWQSTMKVVQCL